AINSGRITRYAYAGQLVSLLGLSLQQLNYVLMLALRTLAAKLLVLMGLYLARWSTWRTRIEQVGQNQRQRLQPATP
ncbi:sulfite exporter TauE/SafE family protein, partial [Oceanobacter sp. 2_MG-2023]|uniref:urease accessory protein UreH domain-containing protein n=1 Tax=Oceanobacter sp. 2_MG-2023 TaxID=3062619 RepID=UPI0027340B35